MTGSVKPGSVKSGSVKFSVKAVMTILLAAGVFLSGICLPGPVRDARAAGLTPVKYEEVIRSVFYLPSYVAFSKGYFKEAGLDVSIKTSWGSDKGTAALLSGNADIVLVGPETAVYIQKGASPEKVRIFCGLTATDGSMLVSREKIDAFDWQSVRGKTIMSWRLGSMPALFLEHILRSNDIDPKADVDIINNLAAPARHGAFVSGKGDFATFFEPDVAKMAANGTGHYVTSIGRQVGNIDYTVFMATQSFIDEKPEVIQAWTNAIFKAQQYALETDADVIAKEVAPFFPKIEPGFLARSIQRYRQLSILKTSPLVEPSAIEALQDLLIEGGLLKAAERVKYEDIVVTRFADNALGRTN